MQQYGGNSHKSHNLSPIYSATCPRLSSSFSKLQAWLPESPRWLLLSGASRGQVEGVVRRAWGSSGADSQAVQQEVTNMLRDNPSSSSGDQ